MDDLIEELFDSVEQTERCFQCISVDWVVLCDGQHDICHSQQHRVRSYCSVRPGT